MNDVSAEAPRDEQQRVQQRTLRIALGIVLVGLIVGTALGRHLRLFDALFLGAFLALLAYYSDWAVKRPRSRVAILSVGGVLVVASLVSDFI